MAAALCIGGGGQLDQPAVVSAPAGGPLLVERIAQRDRLVVLAGLIALTLLAWLYLLRMAGDMRAMAGEQNMHAAMGMPDMAGWGAASLFGLFLMWTVMMVGMMLPSAAPTLLLVTSVYRRRGRSGARALAAAFAGGYLLAWTGFSGVAAVAQVALHNFALLTPEMASASTRLAGALFIVAGIYQFLPLKNACLIQCRSPLGFLTREWREGIGGALTMGLRHGTFCVGCCWALMLLLFAAGVMSLLWVAALAAFVLLEKLVQRGPALGRVAGAALVAWGGFVLIR